jgi:hypothetical protein
MNEIARTGQPASFPVALADGPLIRFVGTVLGGTLPALAFAVLSKIGFGGEFANRGNTLEGFPYDALLVAIGTVVGLFLGCLAAPRVAATKGPVRWIVGLALLAPPLGGLVFMALTAIQELGSDGDFSRWASWFLLTLAYSYVLALPTTIAVSLLGSLLLRRLVHVSRSVLLAACALLIVSATLVGGASLATTVGTFGIGPGAPQPVPTLAAAPPVARERAIATAAPYATELSMTPAVFVSADAYKISDLCVPNGGFPTTECEYPGNGWAVVFAITAPDGQPSEVLVMIDAVTGEMLYTSQ